MEKIVEKPIHTVEIKEVEKVVEVVKEVPKVVEKTV